MAIKALLFSRVSTVIQSLREQKEAIKREALLHYKEDEILHVEGKESGVNLEEEQRATLTEMKQLIKKNPTVESIYFFAVDRLARRVRVVVDVVDDLTKMGINCVFLNPSRINTIDINGNEKKENPMAHLVLLFLSHAAEMEAKMIKARIKNSVKIKREQGKKVCGTTLFGYTIDKNGTIQIDEEKAKIIRTIFNKMTTERTSALIIHLDLEAKADVKNITDYFKSDDLKITKTKRIANIITNLAYSGRNCDNEKKKNRRNNHTTNYPPIVDAELQNEAIEKYKGNKMLPKVQHKNIYFAKGLIYGMHENKKIRMITLIRNCIYSAKNEYVNFGVNINVIDSLCHFKMAYGKATMLMMKKETDIKEYEKKILDNNGEIANLKGDIENVQKKLIKIQKLLIDGRLSDEIFDEEKKKLTKELDDYNSRIAKFETENQTIIGYMEAIKNDMNLVKEDEIDEVKKVSKKSRKEIKGALHTFKSYYKINSELMNLEDESLIKEYVNEVIEEIQVYPISKEKKKIIFKLNPLINESFKEEFEYTSKGRKIEIKRKVYDKDGVTLLNEINCNHLVKQRIKRLG
jgi:resolvase, N terminal domain|nr:MAG TPA: integrase [Siphoviridae sp. ctTYz13]